MDLGKVDREFLDAHVLDHLGAPREDVALGPAHGVDFGVVDVDGTALVAATDPVSILPALGWERAAEFALGVVLADVAVSGIPPSHLAVSFSLPPEMTDEAFAAVWETIDAECRDLGVSVLTGHTARYSGCSFPWVGAATALAVGDHADVVRPDGARPGDRIVVTNGPAAEAAGLLTTLYPAGFDLDPDTLAAAQSRLEDASCVREALRVAAAADVHAMHDATEGGLAGALNEVAAGAGVRIDVDGERVPYMDGVRAACRALDVDPWACTSSGTLVVAVPPEAVDDALDALHAEGATVAEVGCVSEGAGVYLDGERLEHPDVDPSWAAYERLATEHGDD
ncbi:hydrogenase expression protein [Halorubellus sp. JP-L1]|uniref:AIR synthase family protein n=1 Tax=Halorubellus sp. JP-L1 TaxID=2715753 RepID=UPI00140D657D|nr:AIR synthase family protein [Halorubellus sp. JP-L1]NHN41926.1 hydrogenase expression protein [Halorubellus sp. JP-L1]